MIDTLRADHLGCYGYFRDTSPNIDAFAKESLFFDQAYTPMATTLPAHLSLFTGLDPLEHGTLLNFGDGGRPYRSRPGARSITELCKDQGYTTGAFISSTPLKENTGFNAGFDTYNQPSGSQRHARATTEAALRWLDVHGKEPFFLFVHLFDPHYPYQPPPPYDRMFRTDADLEAYLAERAVPEVIYPSLCRGSEPTVTRRAVNLYDGEIRYADQYVGVLLDALRDRGLWDRSVIVLAGDHGEGLNQHDWPQHGRTWNEQTRVPLMIRMPGSAPGVFEPLVSLLDVFPTILSHCRPAWVDEFLNQARGVDVLARDYHERPLLAQRSNRECGDYGGSRFVLTTTQWRYHHTPGKADWLFDRRLDPFELRDVAAENATLVEQFRQELAALRAELEARGETLRVDTGDLLPDAQTRREIEALGYSESAAPPDTQPSNTQPRESAPQSQPAP